MKLELYYTVNFDHHNTVSILNMKLLILIFVCVHFTFSLKLNQETIEKWNELIRPYNERCISESGVKKELADSLYTNLDYPDDQNFKCYVNCLSRELGVLDSNNKFDKGRLAELTLEDQSELLDSCIKKAEQFSKQCEIGFIFTTCGIISIAKKQNP
ncbi:hypothetical protein RI129_002239 [Pyrocoelia pectoralis]|uniref:Uncharacterized protein n=1 Tax=Pyrocoelia pectoralis TaxID=417401 RepID=A0AAN7ZLX5_9COLE